MSDKLKIEWTGATWWASSRLPGEATAPLRWRKPRRALVRYWSDGGDGDLFADVVSDKEIDRVFAVMAILPRHTFVVLTKRSDRMRAYMTERAKSARWWKDAARALGYALEWDPGDARPISLVPFPLPNVWLGVSVENQATADERIPPLLQTPAAMRLVSYEPALGPVDFTGIHDADSNSLESVLHPGPWRTIPWETPDLRRIDWIVVGGESGPGARPCDTGWIRSTVWQCKLAGVACFVKQLGAQPRAIVGESVRVYHFRDRKGADMAEWPEDIRVRELPGQVRA